MQSKGLWGLHAPPVPQVRAAGEGPPSSAVQPTRHCCPAYRGRPRLSHAPDRPLRGPPGGSTGRRPRQRGRRRTLLPRRPQAGSPLAPTLHRLVQLAARACTGTVARALTAQRAGWREARAAQECGVLQARTHSSSKTPSRLQQVTMPRAGRHAWQATRVAGPIVPRTIHI